MKTRNSLSFTSCNEDDPMTPVDDSRYMQEDQMGRPAINTVFVSSGDKDAFNTTVPSAQGSAFAAKFNDKLLALNPAYTTNALGLDAATFTGVLATDVLTVSTEGKTTFFDGTNYYCALTACCAGSTAAFRARWACCKLWRPMPSPAMLSRNRKTTSGKHTASAKTNSPPP